MSSIENSLPELPVGLQFYWIEVREQEKAANRWGQLAGGTHRFQVIIDELEAISDEEDIEVSLVRLAYHLENYFVRVFELRERLLGFLQSVTSQKAIVDNLRHPLKRGAALKSLQGNIPSLIDPLDRILSSVHADINLRNTHTHETYLNLGLSTGNDIYDPFDALTDVEHLPDEHNKLEQVLRKEIKRIADEYIAKVRSVRVDTWAFLKQAELLIHLNGTGENPDTALDEDWKDEVAHRCWQESGRSDEHSDV